VENIKWNRVIHNAEWQGCGYYEALPVMCGDDTAPTVFKKLINAQMAASKNAFNAEPLSAAAFLESLAAAATTQR